MNIKHSISLGVLGKFADRFHIYQESRSLEERLRVVKTIPQADGVEIIYPQDFDIEYPENTIALLKKYDVKVSAVNVNLKSEAKWRFGSLTSRDPYRRQEAVEYISRAMEVAEELGCYLVTCCPLIDGWDYAFQVDYAKAWGWLIEGLKEACSAHPKTRLALEYKPFESKNYLALPNAGYTLYICEKVGAQNLGVTLDFGHALMGGEMPAAAVVLALQANRLFYMHLNDNNRVWDWDMLPGSVSLWELLEVLFHLERAEWNGWFAYDVHTREADPDQTVAAAIYTMRILIHWVQENKKFLEDVLCEGRAALTYTRLIERLFTECEAGR